MELENTEMTSIGGGRSGVSEGAIGQSGRPETREEWSVTNGAAYREHPNKTNESGTKLTEAGERNEQRGIRG